MPDIHEGVSWCATQSISLPTKTPAMPSKSTVPSTAPCWHRTDRLQEAPAATSATTAVRQSREASAAILPSTRARTSATGYQRRAESCRAADGGGMATCRSVSSRLKAS